jgi:transposase-like protein
MIATLRPASGGPSGHDNFRCETCKSHFTLQI